MLTHYRKEMRTRNVFSIFQKAKLMPQIKLWCTLLSARAMKNKKGFM